SVNLWGRANDTFLKKNYRPGQHGATPKRETTYGAQLRAKQKLKKYYSNMTETQFKNYFLKARKEKGDSAENFVGLLERRLDAVVYRANFAPTFYAARQVVGHRHILVNGKTVNISSYLVKPGDAVEVKQSSRTIPLIAESLAKMERPAPVYINLDADNFSAKYNAAPKLADIPYPVEMEISLIVEFYSR
ncbi:MAG: 30S ribosomal protein S4, partial [Rickettsiales bacterium]|nr:30S ribosomal protein S4 [Rickettsiales bacterium]